ncbi:transcriptional regulator [Aureimonas flava]|uniref:Transcriptional regulator n=1 Tax=Aureimonas flava TaxID=2320271 RepID=A0A3A1WIS9_9HYPH|nr:transcriptional regulator [Aureimonas flava]RIY00884.1 transcriptional regulator [Aureimonas flava]
MDMPVRSETLRSSELGDIANRAEKGSAMRLIRAETKATNDKTARLRALRLAREAEEAVVAAAEAAAKPAKRPRKTAAKVTAKVA